MGSSASARPLVTTSLEFGFTTRMRRREREAMLASSSIWRHCCETRARRPAQSRGPARKRCKMPQAAFDCVIRAGRVGTAVDEFDADIGIKDGVIAAIGRNLGPGTAEIDAKSKLVLPGGIDAHAHIEQLSAAGIV